MNSSEIKAPAGYIKLTGTIDAETDKATLFFPTHINDEPIAEGFGKAQWFPISQTKSRYKRSSMGDRDVIIITNWIAKQKNLI